MAVFIRPLLCNVLFFRAHGGEWSNLGLPSDGAQSVCIRETYPPSPPRTLISFGRISVCQSIHCCERYQMPNVFPQSTKRPLSKGCSHFGHWEVGKKLVKQPLCPGDQVLQELVHRSDPTHTRLQRHDYDFHTDIWSLGLIMFELYCDFHTVMERDRTLTALRQSQLIPAQLWAAYPRYRRWRDDLL